MNIEDFERILEKRLVLIKETLTEKGGEYAYPDDRFYNFGRAANMLECTREQALVGMLSKHLVSILDIVDRMYYTHPAPAVIEEKIGDAINYLILLEAMLYEEAGKE